MSLPQRGRRAEQDGQFRDIVTSVLTGKPAEEIVEYASTEDIDLILMGTAGRGGFERLVIGSVADDVVRTAEVPVVTVRPSE